MTMARTPSPGFCNPIIEASFRYVDRVMRDKHDWQLEREGLKENADSVIAELNYRLREHGVGYRFEGGMLVRIDSELLHAEVTVPALRLLHDAGFEGPLEEFMNAHAHFRKGEMKDANVDALNALESTLKAICDARKWKRPPTANGAGLVQIVVNHGLIPSQLQEHFGHLIDAMKKGLPPIRHNFGGKARAPR